jgi:hypothetical protein
MRVEDFVRETYHDPTLQDDLRTVLRDAGAVEALVLNLDAELTSRLKSTLEILVDFEPGRTLGDLLSLEGELELLLGYRVSLITRGSKTAGAINEAIKRGVALHA